VIDLAPATAATRAIDGFADRLCAAPTRARAKGGLQFFFRRLLAADAPSPAATAASTADARMTAASMEARS
jgi:hypothetical protein